MLKLAPVGRAKAHVEQGDGVDFRQRKQPEESNKGSDRGECSMADLSAQNT